MTIFARELRKRIKETRRKAVVAAALAHQCDDDIKAFELCLADEEARIAALDKATHQ